MGADVAPHLLVAGHHDARGLSTVAAALAGATSLACRPSAAVTALRHGSLKIGAESGSLAKSGPKKLEELEAETRRKYPFRRGR